MFLHIVFEDGSNPYVKYGTDKELKKEIKRWEKNFDLDIGNVLDMKSEVIGYRIIAEDKRKAILEKERREAELNGGFIPLF